MSAMRKTLSVPADNSSDIFAPVDCITNPWNLSPVVQAIMNAQNWILERIPPWQKLVIVIGEMHDDQNHSLLQLALLKTLSKQYSIMQDRNFSFGYEATHNFLKLKGIKDKLDPYGLKTINAYDRYHGNDHNKSSKTHLLNFCKSQGISVSFNDIADTEHLLSKDSFFVNIDQRDPFSRDLVQTYRPHLRGKKIKRCSMLYGDADGIALSNLAMVAKTTEHMKRMDTRIYVQECGIAHVMGSSDKGYDYKDSLSARYKAAGFYVLPVLPSDAYVESVIPQDAEFMFRETIKARNLAKAYPHNIAYDLARHQINAHSGFDL